MKYRYVIVEIKVEYDETENWQDKVPADATIMSVTVEYDEADA